MILAITIRLWLVALSNHWISRFLPTNFSNTCLDIKGWMKPIHFGYYARYCTDEPLLLLSACFVWNTKTYKGWYAKYNLLIKVHFNTLQIFLAFDGIIDKVVPYQIHDKHFSSSSYDFKNRKSLIIIRQNLSK